jgi:sugar phosphate isomerase/epimerase
LAHRFGISTHLFHAERLAREHLVEVAAHGFEGIELYATRTHFDYRDPQAAAALAEWLDDTRLALLSVHAPTTASYLNGTWGDTISIGAASEERRREAVAETTSALSVARTAGGPVLVLHLGFPSTDPTATNRASVARSLEEIAEAAEAIGVALALELIPNGLSLASRLVQWLEGDTDLGNGGICLDVGHANLVGDPVEAIETCSGHIITTHLHDNRGRKDEHLVPGEGGIDWPGAMLAFQKVGYDGPWVFELRPASDSQAVLGRAARARTELERMLDGGY